jgi:hypothetical protein
MIVQNKEEAVALGGLDGLRGLKRAGLILNRPKIGPLSPVLTCSETAYFALGGLRKFR